MKKHDFLVEVGLEEMPAQYVRQTSEQFEERITQFLRENRLDFEKVKHFATPRRFAVLIQGLADAQADFEEVAKGPARRIAQDKEGNWTKAALGFARGKGLSTDDIYFEEVKGEDYAHVNIKHVGEKAQHILEGIQHVITDMTFPVRMFWSSHRFEYIRPIHWIVALLDNEVIPFSIVGINSGNQTRGHRFLGHDTVKIEHAAQYEAILDEEKVIADQDKRKEKIAEQIHSLSEENGVTVPVDEDLLEEVTQIVEYPTAFMGSFDEKYLELPAPVLITSMRENQRYFAVENKDHSLANHFIALRNGDDTHIDIVRSGNEKVLVARLEDALFFVSEDQKRAIDDYAKKLENVTFHAEIGSMMEKCERTGAIAQQLYRLWATNNIFAGELVDDMQQKIERLAEIYKFDLVTQTVDEFSELQGVIGEIYAKNAGEDEAVAVAIREHYMPLSSDSETPKTPLGILFSLADKIDTIISFFAINRIPSGSNDPFALRRQMIGIVTIIEENGFYLEWRSFVTELLNRLYQIEENRIEALVDEFVHFLNDRLKQNLQSKGIRHDLSQAARGANAVDINLIIDTAETLESHQCDETFKTTVEAWQRVLNLVPKAEKLLPQDIVVKAKLYETESEKALYDAVSSLTLTHDSEENYIKLVQLVQPITNFFNDNMVFTENEEIRNNRLAILMKVARLLGKNMAASKIQTK